MDSIDKGPPRNFTTGVGVKVDRVNLTANPLCGFLGVSFNCGFGNQLFHVALATTTHDEPFHLGHDAR